MADYSVINTRGTRKITIPDELIDDSSTSLTLFGRFNKPFGRAINQDWLRSMENFCNTTPPENPIEGQLWYDSATEQMKICTNSLLPTWDIVLDVDTPPAPTPAPSPTPTPAPVLDPNTPSVLLPKESVVFTFKTDHPAEDVAFMILTGETKNDLVGTSALDPQGDPYTTDVIYMDDWILGDHQTPDRSVTGTLDTVNIWARADTAVPGGSQIAVTMKMNDIPAKIKRFAFMLVYRTPGVYNIDTTLTTLTSQIIATMISQSTFPNPNPLQIDQNNKYATNVSADPDKLVDSYIGVAEKQTNGDWLFTKTNPSVTYDLVLPTDGKPYRYDETVYLVAKKLGGV